LIVLEVQPEGEKLGARCRQGECTGEDNHKRAAPTEFKGSDDSRRRLEWRKDPREGGPDIALGRSQFGREELSVARQPIEQADLRS